MTGRFQIEAGVLNHPADRSDTSTQSQHDGASVRDGWSGSVELRDSRLVWTTNVKNAAIEAYEAGKLAAERGAAAGTRPWIPSTRAIERDRPGQCPAAITETRRPTRQSCRLEASPHGDGGEAALNY